MSGCWEARKDITVWCCSFPFHLSPCARGTWDALSLPVRYQARWHLAPSERPFYRRWDLPKRNNKSPYSESCCEALHLRNGVFYFEKTLIRYTKEGERTWIRLKSDFNIRHLAAAPALPSQITAIDDALRCPLERGHRIPWIMMDSVTYVVFREHVPMFIQWLLGNHAPMAVFWFTRTTSQKHFHHVKDNIQYFTVASGSTLMMSKSDIYIYLRACQFWGHYRNSSQDAALTPLQPTFRTSILLSPAVEGCILLVRWHGAKEGA